MGDPKFNSRTAVSLHIGGINVKFPVKPYPSQLSMMSQIIRGLERKHHCLLESPTGSGKSLALLCSAIAWQQTQKAKFDDDIIAHLKSAVHNSESQSACTCEKSKPASTSDKSKYFDKNVKDQSVINLCSDSEDDDFRPAKKQCTEGSDQKRPCESCKYGEENAKLQLTEEKEFRKPRFPKIWFGTRTHKQIAQITKELGRTSYKATRMTILSSRQHSCVHPAVMTSSNKNEECKELRKGTHVSGARCAFYANVNRMKNHYQLDCAGMTNAWDLEDLVGLGKTIKACPFYGARELISSADIIFCPYNYLIDPMIRSQMKINPNNQIIIMDEAHNIEDSARDAGSYSMTEESLANTTADLQFLINDEVKLDDHRPLHLLCTKVGQWIGEHSRNLKPSDYESSSDVWFGRHIINHLNEWGITQDTLPLLEANYSAAIDIGEENPEEAKVLHSSSQATLGGLFNVLRYLMTEDYKYCDDYRVTILRQAVYKVPPPKRTKDGWITLSKRSKKHFETTLNFWCLNPSVAFNDLKQAHCIILTSGTLSPMSSFSSELGLSFPIQLEANHVIKDSQVWVGAIGCGPKGIPLEATYKNTDRFDFQDELGEVILQVCHVIPHGVLCFFSSYSMLQKLQQRWQSTGLWHKLEQRKRIVCEPRSSNKEEFESLLNSFYEAIKKSETTHASGGLMFAVCRGKVSEGLDFADNNARAVITVGIPFPSIKDKQVELKRKYNDIHKTERGLLSGSQWYEIQAYRAMNQALGRCIRHRDDWGALIIIDERFCKNPVKYAKGLSKWVRHKMHAYPQYAQGKSNLEAFVEKWQSKNSHQDAVQEIENISPTLPELSLTGKGTVELSAVTQFQSRGGCIRPETPCESGTQEQTDTSKVKLSNLHGSLKSHVNQQVSWSPKNPGTPDKDFEKSNLPQSVLMSGNKKHTKENVIVKTATSDVMDCPEDALLHEDFFNDTIAPTPEKEITIIPESPISETKDSSSIDVGKASERVRQQLVFDESTADSNLPAQRSETKKRKQSANSHTSNHVEVLELDESSIICDSGELLPRRKRMKKKSEKKAADLNCCGCNQPLCKPPTNIDCKEISSFFMRCWLRQNLPYTRQGNDVECYCVSLSDIERGTLVVLESGDLNSHWCETDEICYKIHQCCNCSRTVAFQVVSDASMRDQLLFPSSLVASE